MILPVRLSDTQRTVAAYFALFVSVLCVIVSCATTTYSYLHHVFVEDISLLVRVKPIECLHDPANVQHYRCWKFAGRLLDRVNTPLDPGTAALRRRRR